MKCDVDVRKELFATVVLAGGTAIFQGMVEHMTKELTGSATHDTWYVVFSQLPTDMDLEGRVR